MVEAGRVEEDAEAPPRAQETRAQRVAAAESERTAPAIHLRREAMPPRDHLTPEARERIAAARSLAIFSISRPERRPPSRQQSSLTRTRHKGLRRSSPI